MKEFPIRISGNKIVDGFICLALVFASLYSIGFTIGVIHRLVEKFL